MMFQLTDTQKIGIGLTSFGIFCLFLGVILFFDKGLLAIGNLVFICGVACVIGIERAFRFFFQRHKIKATVAFFGGIIIVLLGWPIFGMCFELYGFVLLFSGFLPFVVNFLRQAPLIGSFLNMPGLSWIIDWITGDSKRVTV